MAQKRPSGIGVWFKEEIENTLRAVDLANLDVAQHIHTPEMNLYRRGYEAAIDSLASAFGIEYARRTTLTPLHLPAREADSG